MALLVRLVAILIALPAGAISVGSMEIGPDVDVEFGSGETAIFETWVNVTDARQFEAVWKLNMPPQDPKKVVGLLREAASMLRRSARARNAESMLVSALWEVDEKPGASTCVFETLAEPPRCFVSP